MNLRRLVAVMMTAAICLLAGCTADTGTQTQDNTGSAQVVRVGVSGDFYPFCYKEDDQLKGFEIDLWERIAEENGWELEYTVSDLSGLLDNLIVKLTDGVTKSFLFHISPSFSKCNLSPVLTLYSMLLIFDSLNP